VLALALFALAWITPTAGFTGKFIIFGSALRDGETAAAIIGIVTAAASDYYYLRVVVNLYIHTSEQSGSIEISVAEKCVLSTAALIILAGLFPMMLLR
jgi:NADH-quinone oxidoreductase subunit N